jgi:uncharacterized protein (TIGR02284 family)
MMETQVLSQDKIVEELNEVLQIDLDAVGAYQSAIDRIDEISIKQQLQAFQGDHQRHIIDLKAIIRRCGGEPRDKPDLQGAIRKGFTALAGLVGTEAALRAMLSNERKTNEVYEHHVKKNFPADILDVLRRNYSDEQRHFAWIESAVHTRLWEQTAQPTV